MKRTRTSTAHEMSEAIRKANRDKILAKYKISPTIVGRKPRGRKPKFNDKKWMQFIINVSARAYEVKLTKKQEAFLVKALIAHVKKQTLPKP